MNLIRTGNDTVNSFINIKDAINKQKENAMLKKSIEKTNLLSSVKPLALAICTILSATPQVYAAPGDTVGEEVKANTFANNTQGTSSIAMDADGDYIITWDSFGEDGDDFGVYAQRYNSDGTVIGNNFRINTTTNGRQEDPDIAMDATGDFVICWESLDQDGDDNGIYAQRYNADGTPEGNEFRVNSTISSAQDEVSVAMNATGDFVITWTSFNQDGDSDGVYAQRYDADGTVQGVEFGVNTTITGSQASPSIAMNAAGDFVISWSGAEQGLNTSGIYAQRYNADGTTQGNEFRVNSFSGHTVITSSQGLPSVAMDADGDFVISWQSNGQSVTNAIYAQRYNSTGMPVGGEFLVDTNSPNSFQRDPSVAMDANGDFVISWETNESGGVSGLGLDPFGIYAQRYNANGVAESNKFLVNTMTPGFQSDPSIAMDADGDFIISWTSENGGSDDGIYAQRYEGAAKTVDLNLVVQDSVDPVNEGGTFDYTIITTNNGSGTALDINLSEPLPTGVAYVSDDAATTGWSCVLANSLLSCNKPVMSAAEVSTLTVTVTAITEGTQSNIVTVNASQTDANKVDNTDTEITEVKKKSVGSGSALSWLMGILLLTFTLRRKQKT